MDSQPTRWPPITIDVIDGGEIVVAVAGIEKQRIRAGEGAYHEAMQFAAGEAGRYRRTLPVRATGPEGTFHMEVTPEGQVNTLDSPPDVVGGEASALTTWVDDAETDLLAASALPSPAALSMVPPIVAPPPVIIDNDPVPPMVSVVRPVADAEPHPVGSKDVPLRPPGMNLKRRSLMAMVIATVLVAVAGSVATWQLRRDTPPALAAPQSISASWESEPTPPPLRSPSPTPSPMPTATKTAKPKKQEVTPTAAVEDPIEVMVEDVAEEVVVQPREPVDEEPPSAPVQEMGLTSMNTAVSTAGGGSATVTVSAAGSGTHTVYVTVGGASSSVTITAPGSGSVTISGISPGEQAWSTSGDGLVNSGSVTVY